jgi:hypothetical protein
MPTEAKDVQLPRQTGSRRPTVRMMSSTHSERQGSMAMASGDLGDDGILRLS